MAQTLDNSLDSESQLPLIRLFKTPTAKVLDFLFENYDSSYTEKEVADITDIKIENVQEILGELLKENILKKTKEGSDVFYQGNFSSHRTEGLFSYVRATLDENFDSNLKSV
jgi:Fic family protein